MKPWSSIPRENGRKPRINREPSAIIAQWVPWLTVIFASALPGFTLIASAPVLPAFGFLVFIAWRQLRPGLLPVWAGVPLGIVDDIFSGQPFGSAVLLFSIAAIALDLIEDRLPWRNYLIEWLVAIALIGLYIVAGVGLANLAGATTPIRVTGPQILISILTYPLVGRFTAVADKFRLTPFVEIR